MATVQKFEDLIVWQKARELTKFIYNISKYRNFSMDRGLVDQIRRASVSVMSNIAEGFDRGTKAVKSEPSFISPLIPDISICRHFETD